MGEKFRVSNIDFLEVSCKKLGLPVDKILEKVCEITYDNFLGKRITQNILEFQLDDVHIWYVEDLMFPYRIKILSLVKKQENDRVSFTTLQPMRKYLEIFDSIRKDVLR